MARVRYILEYNAVPQNPASTQRVILPLVSDVNFSRAHAVKTTWTLGKKPVHHYSGIRDQKVTLSGRSGLKTRFETEGVTSFPASDQSGPALFRKFEKYIEDYEEAAAAAMRQNEVPPTLILRMLFEEKKLSVEPENFTWRRSAVTSRFSYEWTLALEAHGVLAFEEPAGPLSALTGAFEVAKLVTRGINAAGIAIQQGTELLQDTKTQLDTFREPLRALGRLGTQARQFTQAADALVQWPKAFMIDFWHAATELSTAVFDSWAVLPFVDRQAVRSEMIDALATIGDARRATTAALGLNFITLPGRVSTYESQLGITAGSSDPALTTRQSAIQALQHLPGGYAIKNGQLVTVYEVVVGDTLQAIAGKELGDRGRWQEIAQLNGMPAADVFQDGSPLIGGILLLVPAPDGAQLPGLDPDDLYGTDLLLGDDGDLVSLGDDPHDVALVRGIANLRQGLRLRFMTEQGQNSTWPDHGLPALVGEPGTEQRLAEAAIEADLQLRRDRRIESVEDLTIVDDGDTQLIHSVLKPVIGKAFDVTVPFPVV